MQNVVTTWGLLTAIATLSGCIPAVRFAVQPDYAAVGLVSQDTAKTSRIPAQNVRVYYLSSPDGFTLRDNELTVEEGYEHVVLGRIRLRPLERDDDWTEEIGGKEHKISSSCLKARDRRFEQWNITDTERERVNKNLILDLLREEAGKVGANAVIYAYSAIGETLNDSDCREAWEKGSFGGGWAVIIRE